LRNALERCVGDAPRFLAEDWTQHVHLHAGEGFDDLLALDDVDHLLATAGLRTPAFRLVKAGQTLAASTYTRSARVGSKPISDLIDVGQVHRHFADGATIVLQGLQRYWPPLTAFCRDLELTFTQPVQANAYITPPVASGLRVHADAHDVFALQTYGRKQWVCYADDGEQVTLDTELTAGDSLYVPRGTQHAARTVDAASVHVTIGVRSLTWRDVLRRVLDDAAAEPAFAEALPAGFAHDQAGFTAEVERRLKELTRWVGEREAGAVAEQTVRRFWAERAPTLTGQLHQLLTLDAIADDTVLARRPGAVCHLAVEGHDLLVVLGDRRLRMPGALEPVLRDVTTRQRFRVAEIDLDAGSRLVLARRLVREGLLIVAA
jgi:lysine-specific demethylase/histidyl-hydroxylase NO66